MKLLRTAVALATASLLLVGCEANKPSSASDNATPPAPAGAAVPLFEPLAQDSSKIPFPVDLLFSGSTDGTLNIPGVANSDSNVVPDMTTSAGIQAAADPMVALNMSSGYSTTAMLTIPFSAVIQTANPQGDQANLMAGIRVFQTKASSCPVNGNNGNFILSTNISGCTPSSATELTYGVDFIASASGSTVAIVPLKPLASATSYIVVVTTSLKSADGNPVAADGQYADARNGQLAPLVDSLTPKVQGQECLVAAATMSSSVPLTTDAVGSTCPLAGATSNIALTYSVTTQNVTAALQQAQGIVATAAAPTIAVAPVPNDPVSPTGIMEVNGANIYAGKVSGMTSFLTSTDPVHSIWNNAGNNLSPVNLFKPDAQGAVDVPVLVTVPADTSSCPSSLPVVIYQHGITSDRGTLLALAGSLASICAVGVAIDLPEHGIMQSDTLGGQPIGLLAQQFDMAFGVKERLVDVGGGAAGACLQSAKATAADGRQTCASGDSYINLTNLANSRDVLRQSVVDLDSLYLALQGAGVVTVDGTGTPNGTVPIDKTKISFVGMSLGSIVGETFVATLGDIGGSLLTATFNVGGGGIAKLLDGSPSFEPVIRAGLAAQGVTKPSATYESFLIAAQTLVDSADPINYADALNALKSSTPILFQEVVGNGGANASDLVVPNNVFGTAFAAAWSAVSGSPQTGWLAGQNTVTNPSALGGADSLVQGTAFVSLAQALQSGAIPPGACPNPTTSGAVCDIGVGAFFGIGLPQVGSQPTADGSTTAFFNGSGLVRFAGGEHSSLLNPDVDGDGSTNDLNGLVTTMMQTQVASFIGSVNAGGTAAATIVGVNACVPVIGAPCTGAIADWTSPLP